MFIHLTCISPTWTSLFHFFFRFVYRFTFYYYDHNDFSSIFFLCQRKFILHLPHIGRRVWILRIIKGNPPWNVWFFFQRKNSYHVIYVLKRILHHIKGITSVNLRMKIFFSFFLQSFVVAVSEKWLKNSHFDIRCVAFTPSIWRVVFFFSSSHFAYIEENIFFYFISFKRWRCIWIEKCLRTRWNWCIVLFMNRFIRYIGVKVWKFQIVIMIGKLMKLLCKEKREKKTPNCSPYAKNLIKMIFVFMHPSSSMYRT